MQVTYNEIMAVFAGMVLVVSADAFKQAHRKGHVVLRSHAYALAVLGAPLALLGLVMSVTWPIDTNASTNIAFGQPALALGVLAIFGAVALARGIDLAEIDRRPVAWVIAAVGLILASIASAIFSYEFMGSPPPTEPITGQIDFWADGAGTTVLGIVYALTALGCLATVFYKPASNVAFHVIRYTWIVPGVFLVLFGVLNFRTHIGQVMNNQWDSGITW